MFEERKKTFLTLFFFLAIILAALPFVTTFNAVITDVIRRVGFYRVIERRIVPFEARMIAVAVKPFGIKAYLTPDDPESALALEKGDGNFLPVVLSWNCLGWQSLLLLLISLFVGLQGKFTLLSQIECIAIGILGTFLVNLVRMAFIMLGIYHVNEIFAMIVHDYFAALLTIAWLFFFWWFSYAFVLETKAAD